MEESNLTQNQQPPVQLDSPSIKRSFTPKFIVVIVVIFIIGGSAYGYATYLARKNFNEVTRIAEEGKRQEEELKQRRLADENKICIQVITPARNPQTGETRDFPTPCDVPEGWEVVNSQQ